MNGAEKRTMKRWMITTAGALLIAAAPARADQQHPDWPSPMHDDMVLTKVMIDRLERRDAKPDDFTFWEGQLWIGGDIDKLWLKSDGSVVSGKTEEANLEAYWSRAVAPFWDLQLGLRHDFAAHGEPARDWVGVGYKGLAPYKFDVDATLYAGGNGQLAARGKVEYDLLLTQRLVLMPELEANAYGKADPQRGLGSGLANLDLGLRLRYEIRREFAPYIGVVWTRLYGDTASQARAGGAPDHDTQFVAGLRAWW